MSYQVVWSRCNVFDAKGGVSTLSRGDFVPDEIDDVQKSQLATIGATRFVDSELPALAEVAAMVASAPIATEAEDPNTDAEPIGFVDTSEGVPSGSPLSPVPPTGVINPAVPGSGVVEPEGNSDEADKPPAKSASKPEWEDFAVSQGMPRNEAESTKKDDLIAQFGS